jgi:hypothetical protein
MHPKTHGILTCGRHADRAGWAHGAAVFSVFRGGSSLPLAAPDMLLPAQERTTMIRNQALALCLVIGGLIANNFIYLYDMLMGKYPEGAIYLGKASFIGIGVTIVVMLAGIALLVSGSRLPPR